MKRTVWMGALLYALGLFSPAPLFAARPLLTEDTETVEKGSFEMELGFDFLREDNRDKYYLSYAVEIRPA